MVEASRARPWIASMFGNSELALRVCSALVLAPLALAVAYVGGWLFVAFWTLAALLVLWEWTSLVTADDRRSVLTIGAVSLLLAMALAGSGRFVGALAVIAIGALAAGAMAPGRIRVWAAAAVPYAGAMGLAPILVRSDSERGFLAILIVFAAVWSTDIFAYFVGRALGGPKLAPRFSPKKTWSGAIGGAAAAMVSVIVIAKLAGVPGLLAIAIVAIVLSAVAQAGDVFESAVKRRFGAKDSSHLIPGHGGLMDRLDGFVAACVIAAVIGVARAGLDAPARGFLYW
jgi:phosphatidate cytidylyltransferase